MKFAFLFNRLFHKKAWINALDLETAKGCSLRQLTAQQVFQQHLAIINAAEEARAGIPAEQVGGKLFQVRTSMDKLNALLPFADPRQRRKISDAARTADYVQSLLIPAAQSDHPAQVTYYGVYIPTLNGRFYYLGTQAYQEGDIVSIPFGREDTMIFGIVNEILCDDYWKMPIPLWKMKYIHSKAPQNVTDTYQHMQNPEHSQEESVLANAGNWRDST